MRALTVAAFLFFFAVVTATAANAVDDDIDDILHSLSLKKKIGQMTQLDVTVVLKEGSATQIDMDKYEAIMSEWGIGSWLNSPTNGNPVNNTDVLDIYQWRSLIRQFHEGANKTGSLPILYGLDSVHGANYIKGATLFPQQLSMAASFDREGAKTMGKVAAEETLSAGIPWIFAPILGIGIQSNWPRLYETFGEDPYVASELGSSFIVGAQGGVKGSTDTLDTAACMKHFLGYSASRSGMDRTPAWIPDRFLHNYFMPSFEAAIEAGVATGMVDSSEINGEPVHASKKYMRDLIRDELEYDGMMVTDWMDIEKLHFYHFVAPTQKDAVRMSIGQTSIDMSMVPIDLSFPTYLLQLVEDGHITEDRINESVRRVLVLKKRLGLLSYSSSPSASASASIRYAFDSNEKDAEEEQSSFVSDHWPMAVDAAKRSVTLLQNFNNALPISNAVKNVAVIGPSGDNVAYQSGGWSIHWQGGTSSSEFVPFGGVSIADGMKKRGYNVTVVEGAPIEGDADPTQVEAARQAAAAADYVILAVGEHPYTETPGNIPSLDLSSGQADLVCTLLQDGSIAGKTTLVLIEGRPRMLPACPNPTSSLIWMGLPGPFGGEALAAAITGEISPSGRLPITYAAKSGLISIPYWRKHSQQEASPTIDLFSFGQGLSYADIGVQSVTLSSPTVAVCSSFSTSSPPSSTSARCGGQRKERENDRVVDVAVVVANSADSSFASEYSALLFVAQEYRSITPEMKMLKAFDRTGLLQPGESEKLVFQLRWKDFAFVNADNEWAVEAGNFTLTAGDQSAQFELTTIA
mmetsp:Transcript_38037/g.98209  ORF Transcript_38037/g.98209 Transcript_38037/m.98209 type:complete len:804 (-) Transcript_38037:159-2570(-)